MGCKAVTILAVVGTVLVWIGDNDPVAACGTINDGYKMNYDVYSPNYPNVYTNNINCIWNVDLVQGNTVAVLFDTPFNLEDGRDFLRITEIEPSGRRLPTRSFTGSVIPPDYTSRNKLEIQFTSDGSNGYSGFKIYLVYTAQTTTCSEHFGNAVKHGYITSPNYPSAYTNYLNCVWNIDLIQGETIRLFFSSPFNLENTRDLLRITEIDPSGTRLSMKSFTGTAVPPIYMSVNKLELRFVTDHSATPQGFGITWEKLGCGGYFGPYQTIGYITSLNYPSSYGENQRCTWKIQMRHGDKVKLLFQPPFELEEGRDVLTITEIQPSGGRTLARTISGTNLPPVYVSQSNTLELQFTSDGANQYEGFRILWERVDVSLTSCDYSQSGSAGVIPSNKFPYRDAGHACTWDILVPGGQFISLEFNWTVAENGSRTNELMYQDWVEVHDVIGNGSMIRRGKWFRDDNTVVLKSLGSRMEVRLYSHNVAWGDVGFHADWKAVSHCGDSLTGTEGYIMSPNYTGNANNFLDNNSNCTWDFSIDPPNSGIRLDISYSNVSHCQYLQVQEYSATNGRYVPHQDWCAHDVTGNTMTKEVTVYSQHARVVYHPGNSSEFFASWTLVCGKEFKETQGNFSSPNYDTGYPSNMDCEWTIQGIKGHMVHLAFQSPFDVESSSDGNCSFDHVEVFDIMPSGALVSHGRFCGSQAPPAITSSSERVMVRFHSDKDKTGRGFSVTWDTACGDVFHTLQGSMMTPNYPLPYPSNFDCRWEIRVPREYVIKLSFEAPFQLEGQGRCDTDYVELYDYTKTGSLVMKDQWCGTTVPPLQTSMTSRMLLSFHSDNVKNYLGFKATWDSVLACGDVFDTLQGNVSSPRFAANHPHVINCQWEIQVAKEYVIHLAFEAPFQLEGQSPCNTDFLELYDYTEQGAKVIKGRWCGNSLPPVQTSISSRLVLVYHSESMNNLQGFRAKWDSVQVCGDVFYSKNGSFSSPGFPHEYPANLDCRWEIHAAGGEMVKLEFGSPFDIDVGKHGCGYDEIEIFDVLSNGTHVNNGQWCGMRTPPAYFSSTQLLVYFKSDLYTSGKGFTASWSTVPGCGYTYSSKTGYIHSPNFPEQYPVRKECRWEITAPQGANITLRFEAPFDLELSNDCGWDYLQIDLGGTTLGKWCGNTPPYPVTATEGQRVEVIFKSDKSYTGEGFYASWTDQQ